MKTAQQITDAVLRHVVTMFGGAMIAVNHAVGNKLGLVSGLILAGAGIGQSILQKLAARAAQAHSVGEQLLTARLETTEIPAERLEVQTFPENAQQPAHEPRRSPSALPLVLLAALLFGAGCASHKSTVLERKDKNGETTKLTRSATRTLFDADTKLANNIVQQGTNGQSIAIGSLRQQSSGSNAVQSLRIMLEMMEKIQGLP
jgi:hypothetical protein